MAAAKLKAETEARAAEAAKAAAAAQVKAEEERAKAEKEASLRAAAEAMAAEQVALRAAAEAKAAEEAKRRTAAEAKSAEDARLRAAAEARAAEETKLRAAAEAKAAEEARIAAAAKRKAEEDAKAKAAIEAAAAEKARVMAAAKLKAETEARVAEEASLAAAEKAKARRQKKAKAAEIAKVRILARARAAGKNRPAEATPKAGEDVIDQAEPEPAPKQKFGQVSSKNCWFYTCQGERLGPVDFEELRAMAADLSLNPRLDMIWKQSMDMWKPAGQIDGLFERNNVSVELAAAVPPSSPAQQSARKPIPKNARWPGARRRSFLLVTLLLPLVWHYALAAASPLLIEQFGSALMGRLLPYAAFAPLVVLLHFGLKRLVNLGMSRWWCLAVFAPLLNLWLGYRCFACPPGYAYHQKLDGRGIALAIIYWLVTLAVVLALAASIALLCGGIESPLLLKQLRGLIRIL